MCKATLPLVMLECLQNNLHRLKNTSLSTQNSADIITQENNKSVAQLFSSMLWFRLCFCNQNYIWEGGGSFISMDDGYIGTWLTVVC